MKIIHTADIHLGSKINKFPKDISNERKQEIRNSFLRMVNYANENGVSLILLSGDVFDSDKPFKKDKDFFLSVVKNNPSITFFYLRGNHDEAEEYEFFDNLKTFSNEWSSYEYNGVVISGIELSGENSTSYYSTCALDKSRKNIVMLHGDVSDSVGLRKINLSKLKGKGIDYLALGHYHSYKTESIDDRGVAVYSGCLEGRGYDETGEKGFVLIDIEDEISHKFIPFSERVISLVKVDVTGLKDAYSIYLRAREICEFSMSDLYRVELVGEVDATLEGLDKDLQKYLLEHARFVDVKDLTKKTLDLEKYAGDTSIIGEFVRNVSDSDFSEEEKARIIAYGLKALTGREIEE